MKCTYKISIGQTTKFFLYNSGIESVEYETDNFLEALEQAKSWNEKMWNSKYLVAIFINNELREFIDPHTLQKYPFIKPRNPLVSWLNK